jgi:hypothetical protein
LADARHLPHGRHQAGTATSTSTETGTTSENARLKRLVANQALDIDMLKELAEGNF